MNLHLGGNRVISGQSQNHYTATRRRRWHKNCAKSFITL